MKKKYKDGLTVLVLLIALSVVIALPRDSAKDIDKNITTNDSLTAVFVENKSNDTLAKLELEVADSKKERRKGLMYRKELKEGKGMLFVWENSSNRTFWMKNTYIPLDMIFITAKRTIRTIKKANPQPNVSEEDLKVYTSEGPAKYVIEANQNFTEEKNIFEGSEVFFN